MERIVVGIDGSDGAARALRWAIGLASETGAEIIAVYALGPLHDLARGTADAISHGLGLVPSGLAWRKELQRKLEEVWCAPLRAAGLPFRTVLEKASAADGLIAVADREDADLIVVGAHAEGSLEDRVLGSVSLTLGHRAHRPVVIVPPTAAEVALTGQGSDVLPAGVAPRERARP
jgi:nucleotide-binding universal stress UspA family protein